MWWGENELFPSLWLFLTRRIKQTDGWDLEDIVPFSTLSLASCAQAAIGGSTELPAVGMEWIVPDLRRIENISNWPQFIIQASSGNWKQSSEIIMSDRLLVKAKLISHWAFSFFLFSILWSSKNDVSIKLFLYLNDNFLKLLNLGFI